MHPFPFQLLNKTHVSRRRFLQTGASAVIATLDFPAITRAQSPNKKLNLAIIGAGGRGASNTRSVRTENIVALCDVNGDNLRRAAQRFPGARGNMPPLKLTWHQGSSKPEIWRQGNIPKWGNGVLFIGDKGMLLSDYGKHVLLPERQFADFQPPPQTLPPSLGHHEEWLHACKTGAPTTCHFGYSGPLTEANHLGNVAYRAGKKLEWDTTRMRIPNAPEAERFLRRDYRKGWSLV